MSGRRCPPRRRPSALVEQVLLLVRLGLHLALEHVVHLVGLFSELALSDEALRLPLLGGEWLGSWRDAYPDFPWVPVAADTSSWSSSNPHVDLEDVRRLLELSRGPRRIEAPATPGRSNRLTAPSPSAGAGNPRPSAVEEIE